MAPIKLKDSRLEELVDELITSCTPFKKSSRNFTLSTQFALSNFRFHKFLDVDSLKVGRLIDGICQKFTIHSQERKGKAFRELCDNFLSSSICDASDGIKTDTHYGLLSLLLKLSDSPVHSKYSPKEATDTAEDEDDFDWRGYLLGDAEEELTGIPQEDRDHWAWSDDEEEADINESDSGISISQQQSSSQQHNDQDSTLAPWQHTIAEQVDHAWITEQIVPQYWNQQSPGNQRRSRQEEHCNLANLWESYMRESDPIYHHDVKNTITETQIIRETIWMLSGARYSFVFSYDSQARKIAVRESIQVSHLTPDSLSNCLKKFAAVGQQVIELEEFVSSVLYHTNNGKVTPGQCQVDARKRTQTFRAFATSLLLYFVEYKTELSRIEKDIIDQSRPVTLIILSDKLQDRFREISTLHGIFTSVINDGGELNTSQSTAKLLDVLYEKIIRCDEQGESARWKVELLLRIFLETLRPLLDFVNSWVTLGILRDPFHEFFLHRNSSIAVDSLAFWNNGITVRSDTDAQTKPFPASFPSFLQDILCQIIVTGKSVELIEGLAKTADPDLLPQCTMSLYDEFMDQFLSAMAVESMDSSHFDARIPDVAAHDIRPVVDAQQAMSVITNVGDPMLRSCFVSSCSLDWQSSPRYEPKQERKTKLRGLKPVFDPFELVFRKILFSLVDHRYRQVCGALIVVLQKECQLMDHLAAMRSFFLFEAGDVMHHFYTDLFTKAKHLEPWQDISYLNSLLQEAVQPRFPQYTERLAVELTATGTGRVRSVLTQSLNGLNLNYKVPWPVNLVIDESCQHKYNEVFLFLLKVKRAKWSLDELRFVDIKGSLRQKQGDLSDEEQEETNEEPTTKSPALSNQDLIHKMFLLRFKLMHFVNSLHTYVMTRILHTTELEFQESIEKTKDLDDVIRIHSQFVAKVYDRCLLNRKVGFVKEAITKVLHLAVVFQARWDDGVQRLSEEAYSKINSEFSKCNHFIITFLNSIVKRGTFPHFESLAYSLCASPIAASTIQGEKAS